MIVGDPWTLGTAIAFGMILGYGGTMYLIHRYWKL